MQIEIRDTRRKQMFQMDDEYLNGYARLCGPWASLVYISLCRHANTEQKAWPKVDLLTEELAISKPTVLKGLEKLEEWGIIEVLRTKNEKTKRQNVNIYVLVDKTFWRPKPGQSGLPGAGSTSDIKPGQRQDKSRVNDVDCKETQGGRKHSEGGIASLSKREQVEKYGFTTT